MTSKTAMVQLLTDTEVLLALIAIAILVALIAVCAQHAASASLRAVRVRWVISVLALLALGAGMALIVAGLLNAQPAWVQWGVDFCGVVVAAMLVTAIRMSIRYEFEFLNLLERLKDNRQALKAYQDNLDSIVMRRTQALRHEIQERRRVQGALEEAIGRQRAELRFARELQQALLAPPPELSFAQTVIHSQPAAEVSGDTYAFHVDNDGLSVVLADAMGHGISAALLTQVVLAGATRLLPSEVGPGVFAALNRMLSVRDQEAFVTASWLRLGSDGSLSFTGAGNAPLLVWRAAGRQVDSLDGSGMALGMFADLGVPYRMQTLQLEPGDRVLLMTDGLIEWANASGEHFGLERIERALADLAADGLPETVAGLQNAAWEFAGMQPCEDDMSLIAIEFRGA